MPSSMLLLKILHKRKTKKERKGETITDIRKLTDTPQSQTKLIKATTKCYCFCSTMCMAKEPEH